jgi:uracil-DNA glycosylase family 4
MPLIPNDDPAALDELLGYLGEIGYGELYLRRPDSSTAAPLAAAGIQAGATAGGGPGGAAAALPAREPGETMAETVAGLAAAARQAAGGGGVGERGATAAESPADPAAAGAALAAMAEVVAACRRCRLCEGRQRTVFGSGNPQAELMFIGEGPGAEEDRQGLPFVGRAGELLTRIVEAIGMTRDQVYIANIVKCRPPGNRDPQPDEVAACRSYLERQITLIRPRLIVALGRIAAQTLLGNDLPIGRMRGQWFQFMGVPLMITYHPAALLRNPALKRPTWEDMQQVRDRLHAITG